VPGATPVINPPDVIVATDVLPELNVPPVVASLSGVDDPAHNEVSPVIAASELTVSGVVIEQLPGNV